MENKNPPFEVLQPGTAEHRDFINRAILLNDRPVLEALQGRVNQPIRTVSNWFYDALIRSQNEDVQEVIVYNKGQREAIDRVLNDSQTYE